jgi:hypothetical protein
MYIVECIVKSYNIGFISLVLSFELKSVVYAYVKVAYAEAISITGGKKPSVLSCQLSFGGIFSTKLRKISVLTKVCGDMWWAK